MDAQIINLKTAHADAVRHFVAVRNVQQRYMNVLNTTTDPRKIAQCNRALDVLGRRYAEAKTALHNAYEAMRNVDGCALCRQGVPMPHMASARCQSGHENHCTCDICF